MFAAKPELALYVTGFATAVVASFVLTFAVRARARRAGLFDPTDERKLHERPVPRIGGLAIFLAVAIALGLVVALFGGSVVQVGGSRLLVVLAGAAAMHALGLYDDVAPLRARWKFLAQIAISLAVYAAGVRITTLSLPLAGIVDLGPVIGLLFTVIWFVGITNAFNLIDGLDGLAAGAALFAFTTMFVVASINGMVGAAALTLILTGATLGFLWYNFHPASIFLGDSGSLFLGFMLAGIGVLSSSKSPTAIAVAIPLVSLGLPVLDTILSIARRFLRGQPIFAPDRGHIHHRLLNLGHSPRKVALLLYAACALLGLGGMLLVNDTGYVALVLLVVGLGVGLAVQHLRFYEFQELARMMRTGMQQRDVIGRRVRIREASSRLASLESLTNVFAALERTFAQDQFHRIEVRLRRAFLDDEKSGAATRADDEVSVWMWSRSNAVNTGWWEIRLPFLTGTNERFGTFVLWQSASAGETGLSNLHAIAGELRVELQRKILALWASEMSVPQFEHAVGMDVARGAAEGEAPIRRDPRSPEAAPPRARPRQRAGVELGHTAA